MASQKSFDYLRLPPETRDMVMQHALVPGDVHPRPSESQRGGVSKATKALIVSLMNSWYAFGCLYLPLLFSFGGTYLALNTITKPGVVPLWSILGVILYVGKWEDRTLKTLLGSITVAVFIVWKGILGDTIPYLTLVAIKTFFTCNEEMMLPISTAHEDAMHCARKVKEEAIMSWPVRVLCVMFHIGARVDSLPGFQLLAACQQTQEEGQRLFYETNIFHLPLGPVEDTMEWLNKLRPEHRDMIRCVCIHHTHADLTAAVLDQADKWISIRGRNVNGWVTDDMWAYLGIYVWEAKLDVLAEMKSLQTVRFRYLNDWRTTSVDVAGIPANKRRAVFKTKRRLRNAVKLELRRLVRLGGWDATRAWLARGGFLPWHFVHTARARGNIREPFLLKLEQMSRTNLR